MANAESLPQCKFFYGATIITVNLRREIIRNGYIRVEGDRIAAVGKCPYPEALPAGTREIDCRGKIIIPGLINTHAHLVQSLLRGLAEDLPLHNWLCDAIWPLEAVFQGDDGFHAARLTMAEMLKTGTTCFLDPMLTYRAGFDQICSAVGEMGIRGCLVCSNAVRCECLTNISLHAVGKTCQVHRNESPTLNYRPARPRPTCDVHIRASQCTPETPQQPRRQDSRLGCGRDTSRHIIVALS